MSNSHSPLAGCSGASLPFWLWGNALDLGWGEEEPSLPVGPLNCPILPHDCNIKPFFK